MKLSNLQPDGNVREFNECIIGEVGLGRERSEQRVARDVQRLGQQFFLFFRRGTICLNQVSIFAEDTAKQRISQIL
jgi:hypothetical protein